MTGTDRFPGAAATEAAASSRAARRVLAQWPFILACGLASMLAGYVLASERTPQYESSTTIRVGTANVAGLFVDQGNSTDADIQRETASAIASFNLPSVRERAAQILDGTVTPEQIAGSLGVAAKANTNIVKVAVRDPDPREAQRISSAMTRAFIAIRVEATQKKLVIAKSQVRRQYERLPAAERRSATGERLKERLSDIDTLVALADGNVDIVQTARAATNPVSPRPKRDAALGLFTGLLLGTLLAALRMRLDDRIRFAGELAEIWDLPVVGLIPQRNELKDAGRAIPGPAALEAMSLARTNLRYLRMGTDVKLLMLTSAVENEGKSTMTWNLAITAAMTGSRVAVVEADLRRPVLSRRLQLSGIGLSEVLAGLAELDEAIQSVEVTDPQGAVAASVDVVPAGMVPPSPLTLFEGETCRTSLLALRERYDVVFIDTPPATVVADALAVLEEVDGVVVVSRLDTLRRASFERLRDVLIAVEAPVIGQLVNSSNAAALGHSYSYSYGPAGEPTGASRVGGRRPRWRRLIPVRRHG